MIDELHLRLSPDEARAVADWIAWADIAFPALDALAATAPPGHYGDAVRQTVAHPIDAVPDGGYAARQVAVRLLYMLGDRAHIEGDGSLTLTAQLPWETDPLLAAAPDLLAACRALVAGFGGGAAEDDPDIAQGRAAIAKAAP